MGDDDWRCMFVVPTRRKDLSSGTLACRPVLPAGPSTRPPRPPAASPGSNWALPPATRSTAGHTLPSAHSIADVASRIRQTPLHTGCTYRAPSRVPQAWHGQRPCLPETHRYAALKGASMAAFTKMEGTTVNIRTKPPARHAAGTVQASMGDGQQRQQPGLQHQRGQSSSRSAAACCSHPCWARRFRRWRHQQQVGARRPAPLPVKTWPWPTPLGNTANPEESRNPTNEVLRSAANSVHWRDSGQRHQLRVGLTTWTQTAPAAWLIPALAGAEATGLSVVDDINGWTYITSNFQHPGDWGSIHSKASRWTGWCAELRDRFGACVGKQF